MKRCKCGSTTFLVDYPEWNRYKWDINLSSFDLVEANVCEAGDTDGDIVCSECGAVYESENDIPDAEDSNEEM